MLTRLRNAQNSRLGKVEMPYSKLKKAVLDILQRELLEQVEVVDVEGKKRFQLI